MHIVEYSPRTSDIKKPAILAACTVFLYLNIDCSNIDYDLRIFSAVIYTLAIIPLLRWFNKGGVGFPCFEILCLTIIPTEALPILINSIELQCFSSSTLRKAAIIVIAFQCALLGGHMWRGPSPTASPFFTEPLAKYRISDSVLLLFACATLYTFTTAFYWPPPPAIAGPIHGVTTGISIVSVYILEHRSSTASISHRSRLIFYALTMLQCSILPLGLIMMESMLLASILVLSHCINARKIPWVLIACLTAITTVLHAGKAGMRDKYWAEERRGLRPSISEVPAFYSEWIGYGLDKIWHQSNEAETVDNNTLLKRASLFQMLCLVVEKSPDSRPFLDGETYADILPQLVPRFFWSAKPQIHKTTHRLGIYYDIQDEYDVQTTTIGFGFIAEAWANFGLFGCITIGFALGYLHKAVWSATQQCEHLSPAGVLMIAFTAFSIETGQTLAVWLSSTIQALLALLILIILYKHFLHGETSN